MRTEAPTVPPMDRLAELRRQRALVQEHLDWLDREIAAAGGSTPALLSPRPAAFTPAPAIVAKLPPSIPAAATPDAREAETILEQYRTSDKSLKTDVRKGCLLYFAAAFVLLGLGVAALWFAFRRE